MSASLAIARQMSHPSSIITKERACRSQIRHWVDRWHHEGHQNRVLVMQRQQVMQSVTAGGYPCCQLRSRNWPWRPLMEEGEELWMEEKHCQNREKWAWEVTGSLWSNNGDFLSWSSSLMKSKIWRGDVTDKRHISDLDCSLGPVDLCMTSRFCKKKSWRHKKGKTSIQRK
jgi:hypothetical protein